MTHGLSEQNYDDAMIRKLISKVRNVNSAMNFSLEGKRINDHLGIELVNLSDITKISPTQIKILKKKIAKHKLVVIKGARVWTDKEQELFTAKLGKLEQPAVYSLNDKSSVSSSFANSNTKETGVLWHSDNSYYKKPSHLSVFQMVKIPEGGTKTAFASLTNLYGNLPASEKEKWKNYKFFYRDDIQHPLLWKHPYTGEDTIYFDLGFTRSIVDDCDMGGMLPVKKSNEIVTYIQEKLSQEASLYTHDWAPGDLIIVDNYAVSHKAEYLLNDGERALMRTTTEGIYF